jgi:hypothetical protein
VIKLASCSPGVGGSLLVLRLPPPLKLVAMIAESGVKTPENQSINQYDTTVDYLLRIPGQKPQI